MKHLHWYYFAALSEDFEKAAQFVEPDPDNFKAYSIEFARLYLAIGSEVDVVAKQLCIAADPNATLGSINTYREIIVTKHPGLSDVEVTVQRNQLTLVPWKEWGKSKNPNWWRQYNNVKHERDKYFKEANLENSLNALAGLLVAVGYLYGEDLRDRQMPDLPKFLQFSSKYFCGNSLGSKGAVTGFRLPGIPMSPNLAKILKLTK